MNNLKAQLKAYYDKYCDERDSTEKSGWKLDIRDKFLSHMKDSGLKSVLEIGAGTGQDSLFFAENGMQATAVDLSEKHIAKCREKGIAAHVMDFEDNSFDCAYAMNCLLHVPNSEIGKVLSELQRVVKKEGSIFICQYGNKYCDYEGLKDNADKGDRFFSFRTFDSFLGIIENAGLKAQESGTVEIGEKDYNSQFFILKNI
jgi:ubiquinone/menaquinone biosynthesis C-methylase UbiE